MGHPVVDHAFAVLATVSLSPLEEGDPVSPGPRRLALRPLRGLPQQPFLPPRRSPRLPLADRSEVAAPSLRKLSFAFQGQFFGNFSGMPTASLDSKNADPLDRIQR